MEMAPNTAREYSLQLFRVLCLNDINSFECLNGQGLKTRSNDKLQQWQVNCPACLFRLASASLLRSIVMVVIVQISLIVTALSVSAAFTQADRIH